MDNKDKSFLEENQDRSRIFDLDESHVIEEWDEAEDIDTLYERNEGAAKAGRAHADEQTKVIRKLDFSEKASPKSDPRSDTKSYPRVKEPSDDLSDTKAYQRFKEPSEDLSETKAYQRFKEPSEDLSDTKAYNRIGEASDDLSETKAYRRFKDPSDDKADTKAYKKLKKNKDKLVTEKEPDPRAEEKAANKARKKAEQERKREERLQEKNAKKLEKQMKKKQQREKKAERGAPIKEVVPPQEHEEHEAHEGKIKEKLRKLNKKRIVAVVLVVVILFGVVFVFANADRFSWHNIKTFVKYGIMNQKSDEHFPVRVQGENVDIGNFIRMGQDICYASDTKLQIINNFGRPEYSAQHGFVNPVLNVSDKYAMIFSLGGKGYQINSYEKTLFSGEMSERIVTGDINDKGTYALVTTSNGYMSKLQVYDTENEKIFGYSFAEYYITSIALAPNGKAAVATGLSALNGSEISSIYVLDFTKEKPLYLEEVGENIFYDVCYLNDTYACAVGNGAVSTINTKNGDLNTTMYDGSTLTGYCFNRDTDTCTVSLSRSGDGRNCEIVSFKTNGEIADSFETEYLVRNLSTYKGRVALLTPGRIYLYSKSGKEVSCKEVTNEPKAVVLYTSSDAYV